MSGNRLVMLGNTPETLVSMLGMLVSTPGMLGNMPGMLGSMLGWLDYITENNEGETYALLVLS